MDPLRKGSSLVAGCIVLLNLGACGGGGGGAGPVGGGPVPLPSGANVAPITVDSGPAGTVNTPFVSVTLCLPGTTTCQTIDHVLVDTASTGLRIVASLLDPALTLPAAVDGLGNPLAECVQFADGHSFGSLKRADVRIAEERASNLAVHVIGDPAYAAVPVDCGSIGPPENTVQTLGAKGILGLGVFREDCGAACATAAVPATYYSCPATGCVPASVALAGQVQNPAWRFPVNNNGAMLVLRSVDPAGAALVGGALVFGIDTQSNNQLGRATVLKVDPATASFTTIYKGQSLPASFLDSGSNGLFFTDGSLPVCTGSVAPGFYCPTTLQTLSATLQSVTGVSSSVSFSVANAESLLGNNATYIAFASLGGINPSGGSFDWGLPFFYGRTVYIAIEGQTTSSGAGPFVAYQ
ncbi:MAG: DUF3443 domain-containing protein [Steroidobacteraceae bacterium]